LKDNHDYVSSLTERYVQRYPWVDAASLRVFFALQAAGSSREAAFSRFYQSMNMERTPGRYSVLRVLFFAEAPVRLSDIRSDMNMTAANVTVLVDSLEKDGLVRRVANESDRRSTFVQLTPAGEAVCADMVPKMASAIMEICSYLSEEQKEAFGALLDGFITKAEQSFRN